MVVPAPAAPWSLPDASGPSRDGWTVSALCQADALSATLDRDDPPLKEGDAIPPGWHLFYIREVVKLRDTARDGHPKRGDFLPPIPRRPCRIRQCA